MPRKKQKTWWKTVSAFTILIFSFQQILTAAPPEWQSSGSGYQPVKSISDSSENLPSPNSLPQGEGRRGLGEGETQDFLEQTLTLIPVPEEEVPHPNPLPQAGEGTSNLPLPEGEGGVRGNNYYDYDRYSFENAIEQFRPEYATAVIVENLTEENLKALTALEFEVGIAVVEGEIVLFSSGNKDEILLNAPAQAILEKADLIAHTHPHGENAGPSRFDLEHAGEHTEYVITEKQIYGYSNKDGEIRQSELSWREFIAAIEKASDGKTEQSNVEARSILNVFIREMDEVNTLSETQKLKFRSDENIALKATDMIKPATGWWQPSTGGYVMLWSGVALESDIQVAQDGVYEIEITANANDVTNVLPQLAVRVDGDVVGDSVSVSNNNWNPKSYQAGRVDLTAGQHRLALHYANDNNERDVFVYQIILRKVAELPAARLEVDATTMIKPATGWWQPSTGGYVMLWSGVALESDIQAPEAGVYEIEVIANANAVEGTLPEVQLKVDGDVVGDSVSVSNNNWNPKRYSAGTVDLTAGQHHLALQYTNDNHERDVFIYQIRLRKVAELPAARVELDATAMTKPSWGWWQPQTGGYVMLWGGVGLESDIQIQSDGVYEMEIIANANAVTGVLPEVQMKVDGRVAGDTVSISNNYWNPKRYSAGLVDLTAGQHHLALQFTNDTNERDVFIYQIRLRKVAELPARVSVDAVSMTKPSWGWWQPQTGGFVMLWGGVGLSNSIQLEEDGLYEVEVIGNGNIVTGTLPEIGVKVDGRLASDLVAVTNNNWNPKKYKTGRVALKAGQHQLEVQFTNDTSERDVFIYEVRLRKVGEISERVEVEAESMTLPSTGIWIPPAGNFVTLWAGGSLNQDVQVTESGEYEIEVWGSGSVISGELPEVGVKIDGQDAGQTVRLGNNSWNIKGYSAGTVQLEAGSHALSVSFLNDSAERDATIDRVVLRKKDKPSIESLEDGTKIYREGQLVFREITPEGDEILYGLDGRVQVFRYVNGNEIRYSNDAQRTIELRSANGTLLETVNRPTAPQLNLENALKVSLENGLEAYYMNGSAVEFRAQNGIRITNFALNADQNITDALLTYPDGTREIIRDGAFLRRIAADGSVTDYTPQKFTVREIFQDHTDEYIYQKISQTQISGLKIQSTAGGFSEYDELGILRKVSNGQGKVYEYIRAQNEAGFTTQLNMAVSSVPEEKTLVGGKYDAQGGVKELSLNNGHSVEFENGRLKKVTDAQGVEVTYSYSTDAFSGLQVTRGTTTFTYNADGFLETLTTDDGTINRRLTDDETVQILLDEVGGNTLSDFELDAAGNIIRGIITTKEGVKQKIENGVLTGFETVDGRVYEMRGNEAVLTEWHFSDGTRVVYGGAAITEILFPDGKRLHQIGFDAQKNIQTFIEELPDGTQKTFEVISADAGTNQQSLRMTTLVTATGATVRYGNDGLAIEVVLADSSTHRVVYARDAQGQVTSITFEEENTYRTFSPEGDLIKFLDDGVSAEIENGEISKLFTRFGNIEAPTFSEQGAMSGEVSFVDGTKLTILNSELVQAVRTNGTKIIYSAGRVSSIETAEAKFDLIYQNNAAGDLIEITIRVTRDGQTQEYPLVAYLADLAHYLPGKTQQEIAALPENEVAQILLGRSLYNALEGSSAQTFLDARLAARTFTASGDVQIGMAQPKLGEGSLKLDGSGDSVQIQHHTDFEFGTSNWTVDFWVKFDQQTQEYALFKKGDHLTGGIQINRHAGINRWDIITAGDTNMSITTTLASGVWHHVALVRDGGTLRFFENGVQVGTVAIKNSGIVNNAEAILIGHQPLVGQFLPGGIDELRVSKGARWASNFTPPAEEYVRDSDTMLLLHFDQAEWALKSEVLPQAPGFTGTPVYFTKLLNDAERGTMTELNSYYFPAWMNLQRNAADYNGGYISRNVTMDSWGIWSNLPAETADILDMNGDGLPDRVYIDPNPNTGYWWVQINNGLGFDEAVKWTGVVQNLMDAGYAMTGGALRFYETRNPHVLGDLTDINGDGRPDRVMQKADGSKDWHVQINNGHGFDPVFVWASNTHPVSQSSALGNYAQEVRNSGDGRNIQELIADFIDMDGDGLKDRVVRPAAAPFDRWFFQKNTGSGFADAITWRGVDSSFDPDASIGGSLSWQFWPGQDEMGESAILIDMNGDNRPDRVLTKNKNPGDLTSALDWYVQLNNGSGFDAAVLWDSDVRAAGGALDARTATSIRYINNANTKRWIFTDLRDVTGDGLPDRVTVDRSGADAAANSWWVEVSTGVTFAPAVVWTGIYGANGAETAISQDQDDFRANRPHDRTPPYVKKVSDLVDMNADGILDRVIFPENSNQWMVQFGTGSGFLPVQAMQMKGVASSTSQILSSRYDYLHVSLKAAENLPVEAGRVKVSLGNPAQTDSYQEWFIDNLTTDWKDLYLKIDQTKSNAPSVKIEFIPASGANAIAIYADNVTFTDFRPNAAKDWLNRMLTEENVISEIHSDRTQTLASYLGLSKAEGATAFDWARLLNAETKIRFTEAGEADRFETFYGSVSKIENGNITETTLPDGSRVTFETSAQNPNQTTQTITGTDGGTQAIELSYGRVRQVSRAGKSPLRYSYEFSTNGKEVTVVYDPDTHTTERYIETVINGQKQTQLTSRTQENGVVTVFTYNNNGALIRSEIVYKGQVHQTFEHGLTSSGTTTLTTEHGVIEEYNSQGVILFHTTPEGYRYEHSFGRAKKVVTTIQAETVTFADGTTRTFNVPVSVQVDDPAGEEIHQIVLVGYEKPETAENAVYENGELKSLSLPLISAARLAFDRFELLDVTDPETEEVTAVKNLLDASVFHPDGTVTEFRNGKPFAVISATGNVLSLAAENGNLINGNESAVFHYAQALKLWDDLVKTKWTEFQAPGTLPVLMEYGKENGKLHVREFAEGVVELYNAGKIDQVLSPDGEVLIQYTYDSEGNPTRIEMGGARRRLESAVVKLKAEIAVEREKALAGVADREAVLNQTIEGQYVVARDRLLAIRAKIESERNKVANISVKGKKGRAAIGDAIIQVQAGLDQVNSALAQLANERANALAQLSQQVAEANAQIETQATEAYEEIELENQKARSAILKQEVSPVIYHWYRKILGRDPSTLEYERWIAATNYESGSFDLTALKTDLNGSDELIARTAQVNAIKTSVSEKLNQYLLMSDAEKLIFAQSLGLTSGNLVALSAAEGSAILDWLNERSLHFGQSAFLALEALLYPDGTYPETHNRVLLAGDLILIDILSGVITPLENDDLVISMFAMNTYAAKHNLTLGAYTMNYAALKALYDAACGEAPEDCDFKLIAHIDGNHYIIITKVTETEVTYTDPGAGPDNALDIQKLSKEEFLQSWGVDKTNAGFGYVLSARAPPESALSAPQDSDAVPSARVLTSAQQQKIRGAFFFFIIPAIIAIVAAIISAVAAIVTTILAVIGTILAAIGSVLTSFGAFLGGVFNGILTGLQAGFGAVLKGIGLIGKGLLGAFNSLHGALLGGIQGFAGNIPWIGGTLSSFTSTSAFSGALKIGLGGYLLQGSGALLDKIGLAPKFAQTLIAGGQIAVGIALLGSGNPAGFTAGLGMIAGGTSGILNTHTNLSPTITTIIGLSAAALTGFSGIAVNTDNIGAAVDAMKLTVPYLSREFASAGLVAVWNAAGMSPYLTGLISVPVRAFAGGISSGIISSHQTIFDGIGYALRNSAGSLISVGASIGLDKLGIPLQARDFLSGFLGQFGASQTGFLSDYGGSVFSALGKGVKELGYIAQKAIGTVVGFGQKVGQFTEATFKKAIQDFSLFFNRQTQENIYADELGLRNGLVTVDGPIWRWESGDALIEYDTRTDLLIEAFGVDGIAQIEGLGQDEAGNIFYNRLTYETAMSDFSALTQVYEQGNLSGWSITTGGIPIIRVERLDAAYSVDGIFSDADVEIYTPIDIDGSEEPTPAPKILPGYYTFKIVHDQVTEAKFEIKNQLASGSGTPVDPSKEIYALVNGFTNESTFDSPDYLYSLRREIVKKSENRVKREDVVLASTYFSSWQLKLVSIGGTIMNILTRSAWDILEDVLLGDTIDEGANLLKDAMDFITETANADSDGTPTTDIKRAMDRYFNEVGQEHRARKMVGVGYSGGFLALAEVLKNNQYDAQSQTGFNAVSLVGLGAANLNVPEAARVLLDQTGSIVDVLRSLDKVVNVTEDIFSNIQKAIESMTQTIQSLNLNVAIADFVAAVMGLLRQGSHMYEHARFIVTEKVQEILGFYQNQEPFNLTSTDMTLLVNVYGTKDVLNELGEAGQKVGGYKTDIAGFTTTSTLKQLVNIEIVGADHGDYVSHDSPISAFNAGFFGLGFDWLPSSEIEWNKMVSGFVADLIYRSTNMDDLEAFLEEALVKYSAEIEERDGKTVIYLPGSRQR